MSSGKNGRESTSQIKRAERFQIDLRAPFIFCAAEAGVLILLCAAICYFLSSRSDSVTAAAVCLLVFVFYLLTAGGTCLFFSLKYQKVKKAEDEARRIDTETADMFKYVIDVPYAVIDPEGKVKVMNGALQDILGYKNAVCGINLSEICSLSMKAILARASNRDTYLSDSVCDLPEDTPMPEYPVVKLSDGRRYEVRSYVMKTNGNNYYFVVFNDVNSHLLLREKYENESPVVAYITLDNLQELTQYVRADYRAASVQVENILNEWASEMHGFIREYDRDRYMAIFSKQELEKQKRADFPIQQKIMSLKIGDNTFPVTVSMGISSGEISLEEKEKAAAAALSLALQRGGNQVAVRQENSDSHTFFGGTHKTMENNTSVISRVSADILEEKIRAASNVLIMGHSNPDFDSIGSAVGAARFAFSVLEEAYPENATDKPKVNIVMDKRSENYRICADQLAPLGIYEDVFVDKAAAADMVMPNTVLIITDVNNPNLYEEKSLAKTVRSIAVIDHHRLAAALPFDPFLQYVETTKSSASEIVSEILEQSRFAHTLHKEEAEVLLSGIMLDTNNFTRNAGSQTFAIIHYLYTRGAHTEVVREFFNEDIEEMLLTSEFESRAQLYRGNIAIACMTGDLKWGTDTRIVGAKVANKLLSVKGIEASFALVEVDGEVIISGRSKGAVNVQLILERLRGGGHFDMAGAQISNSSVQVARELLKGAIEDYYNYDYRKDDL